MASPADVLCFLLWERERERERDEKWKPWELSNLRKRSIMWFITYLVNISLALVISGYLRQTRRLGLIHSFPIVPAVSMSWKSDFFRFSFSLTDWVYLAQPLYSGFMIYSAFARLCYPSHHGVRLLVHVTICVISTVCIFSVLCDFHYKEIKTKNYQYSNRLITVDIGSELRTWSACWPSLMKCQLCTVYACCKDKKES